MHSWVVFILQTFSHFGKQVLLTAQLLPVLDTRVMKGWFQPAVDLLPITDCLSNSNILASVRLFEKYDGST